MSTLFVDTINEQTTGNGIKIPGHVIQVVTGEFNVNVDVSSTTLTASGVKLSITPKFSNSKILVSCCFNAQARRSGATPIGSEYTIFRDGSSGTDLFNDSDRHQLLYSEDSNNNHVPTTLQAVDSPATTSSTEYELFVAIYAAGIGSVRHWGKQFMTIMEIAQ